MDEHREIEELLASANFHLDRHEWESFARLFAPDALLVTPSGRAARGRVELRGLLEEQGPRARRHLNVNVKVTVEGDRAKVTSVQLVLEAGREPAVLGGYYCVDLLTRDGGRWRFAARRLIEEQRNTSLST